MFAWLVVKIAKPILPVLLQTYKVVVLVDNAIIIILAKADAELGTPIYKNIEMVSSAVMATKTALAKVILFMGGEVPLATSLIDSCLEKEIKKLKRLL